ncbi:hypothetical protein GGI15_001795 [Coemansia interrupta]|uniref:Uncharacterized protein n=1 Tax=Coemansia interrupta TaxID=1126814 RepID=A0A9W8HLL4_9FUNG|nr:hypothetical protein GGI15_001795 [Coemansia interrupta]
MNETTENEKSPSSSPERESGDHTVTRRAGGRRNNNIFARNSKRQNDRYPYDAETAEALGQRTFNMRPFASPLASSSTIPLASSSTRPSASPWTGSPISFSTSLPTCSPPSSPKNPIDSPADGSQVSAPLQDEEAAEVLLSLANVVYDYQQHHQESTIDSPADDPQVSAPLRDEEAAEVLLSLAIFVYDSKLHRSGST